MKSKSEIKDQEKNQFLQKELLTSDRKMQHIRICLEEDVESQMHHFFDDFSFVHQAIPNFAIDEIDISTTLFGKKLKAPIISSAITGGHEIAKKINGSIASVIQDLGLGMGVGSQRAALEDQSLEETFSIVRDSAPDALIIGNIGAPQIIEDQYSLEKLEKAISMVSADALAIHLNPLQEACQWEGDTNFNGVLERIESLSKDLSKPIVVKEVGSGISKECAKSLEDTEVAGIEICGMGGTSWAAVESYRAKEKSDDILYKIGQNFKNWGIPTPLSIIEVKSAFNKNIIASGGVRSGIDAAMSIALGASSVGIANPILKNLHKNNLENYFKRIIKELKIVMFLVGAKNLEELRKVPIIITGKSQEWIKQRNIDLSYRNK